MVSYGSVRSVERNLTLGRVKRKAVLAACFASVAAVCLLAVVSLSYDSSSGTSLLEFIPHRSLVSTPSWMGSMLSGPAMYAYQPSQFVKPALAQQLAVMSDIPSKFDSEDPQVLKTEADEVETEREGLEKRDAAIAAKRARLLREVHAINERRRDGRSLPAQRQQQPQQKVQTAVPKKHVASHNLKQEEPNEEKEEEKEPSAEAQQPPASVYGRFEGPMRWSPEMGTDISFIPTDDFPRVMEGSWHTAAETAQQQADANKREAQLADALLEKKVQRQAAQLREQQDRIRRLEEEEEENREEEEARFYSQPAPAQPAPPSAMSTGRSSLGAPTTQLRATTGSTFSWKKDDSMSQFSKKLQGFLGNPGVAGGSSVGGLGGLERMVAGNQKAMAPNGHLPLPDQRAKEEEAEAAEAAGEMAGEEAAEEEWEHPEQKGSPCNWPGQCNRGVFEEKVPGRFAERKNQRFMTPQEIEEMRAEEAQEDKVEAEEKEAAADERLKARWEDKIFGGSMDDFVPGKDAYHHNLLTSSTYGVDHFGKFAPFSKENNEVMYGRYYKVTTNALGEPSQTEKGNLPGVKLGENGGKIGGSDDRVAAKDSMPAFPTEHPHDQFADWEHDSAQNQRMLHGRYWKELRRDGFFDRLMPTAEAEKHLNGGGNDRGIADHVLDWSMYDQAQREKTHGEDWDKKAFTGTDESIEERKGTVSSGTPYLKVATGGTNVLRQLRPVRWVQAYP